MAKKKKKAKDARGYSQGGPTSTNNHTKQNAITANNHKSRAPSVSTKTHSDMKDLLHQFDNSNDHNMGSSSNNTIISDLG